MDTHAFTIGYNPNSQKLSRLPNGELEFQRDKILVEGQKSFLKNSGGAVWFNSHLDYNGKFMSYVDVKQGKCISRSKFADAMQKRMRDSGKVKLCVNTNP